MNPDKHDCSKCPHNTEPHSKNPEHACQFIDTTGMSPRRQKVIKIVHRLMANNPHPWCHFEYEFRFMVVQSAVVALEHEDELARRKVLLANGQCERSDVYTPMRPHHIPHHRESKATEKDSVISQ